MRAALVACLFAFGDDGPATPREIRALHLDLLGRPPASAEREGAASVTRRVLADRLVGSSGFWNAWLEAELYYFLLIDDFRPTLPSIVELPERLRLGEATVPEAIHLVLLSPNFSARNPGPDTFVTVVLEQCLGTTVQDNASLLAAGKRFYDGRGGSFLGESGKGQADVVRIALRQPAFFERTLERQYARLFGEPPPRAAAREWAARFRAEPAVFAELVREWLASKAYEERLASRRPMDDLLFARSLYVDLLDRPPTEEEFRGTRNALRALSDPRPLRAVLARLLLSGRKPDATAAADPEAWVRGAFRRLLGRDPTPKEAAAFVSALREPDGREGDILEAIVNHPEYAHY